MSIDDLLEFLDVRQNRRVFEPEAVLEGRNFLVPVRRAAGGVFSVERL